MDTGEVVVTHGGKQLELLIRKRRRVTSIVRRVGWLNFKLSLAAWALVLMFIPPAPVVGAVGYTIHLIWTGMALVGALTSAVGITISFWPQHAMKVGVPIELTGLALMIVGPLIYFTTQLNLAFSDLPDSFQSRIALVFYAWAMVCAVIARLCAVIPRFHREK
uniref:Membrane protein n=1 Tax=Micrococcus phage Kurnik TaxID=3092208 RepID=A0AAU6R666_9CAUD